MSFISKINLKQKVRINSRSVKKMKYAKIREYKKNILMNPSKDEKLIYAFFLDIA
tara:strand:- start:65 stop:229 length:165 start_codon:yes stop_codon:yes gene_type:complete